MTARCKTCNKANNFRNQRGAKLSDRRCDCGGTLEIMGGSPSLAGKHPFRAELTYPANDWFSTEYFYAEKNRSGQFFVFHEGYFHPIENPVLTTRTATLNPQ